MPLYPWLLALNDPEKPAGDVLGLGLVNWRDCIGEGGGRVKGSKSFYDTKRDNSFMFFATLTYPFFSKKHKKRNLGYAAALNR